MFMHRIKLENILSFGPDAQDLALKPLNVLIGPNGAGKSNLIEVIGLLKAATSDITTPMRGGGGGENWMWRGEPTGQTARVEVSVGPSLSRFKERLVRYSIAFSFGVFGGPHFQEEIGEVVGGAQGEDSSERFLERDSGRLEMSYRDENWQRKKREVPLTDIKPDQSVLSQLKDPMQYPELTILGLDLEGTHIYREWTFGRNTPPRLPQRADLPNRFLEEDGSNLGMVLNRLRGDPKAKNKLLAALRKLYDGVEDFDVHVEAGSVQVFLQEGNITMPATRLSDGTLRYLCLLAILCHPSPPKLVCLEEPELGLHPDILPGLADLLREASERCQLIVTTHSDTLVDALTDTPESIVICEKENGQTKLKRLDKKELSHWLEKYRLGELWTSGELGGNRW